MRWAPARESSGGLSVQHLWPILVGTGSFLWAQTHSPVQYSLSPTALLQKYGSLTRLSHCGVARSGCCALKLFCTPLRAPVPWHPGLGELPM